MKNFLSIIIGLSLFIKILSIDVLEVGETKESTLGYIIFNSTSIKEGEYIKFKIKAYSFIENEISYYYIDDLEKIDIDDINKNDLYHQNFTNNISSEEDSFKVNNFLIYKSSKEYATIEGKFLIIFYYSNESFAEITNVIEKEEKKEEDKGIDKKYFLLLLLLVVIVYFAYDSYKKRKKKKIQELKEIEKKQKKALQENKKELQKRKSELEQIKTEKDRLETEANIRESERKKLEMAEEQRKKQEQKKREILLNYVEGVKEKFPEFDDIVIMVRENENINDLISLRIQSGDQIIRCIVICKKNEIFNSVINKVFEKKPEFKNYSNYFLSNGSYINEYKSLEENKIKDGHAILLYKRDDD